MKIGWRNRQKFAEQALHVVPVQARGATKKFGWVNHVGNAARVDVNLKAGILADERPGGTSVIKMDVSQEDSAEIGNIESVSGELLTKSGKSGGGPWVNERHVVFGAQEGGRNRLTMAGPIEVNGNGRIHGRKECSATKERNIAKRAGRRRGRGGQWVG